MENLIFITKFLELVSKKKKVKYTKLLQKLLNKTDLSYLKYNKLPLNHEVSILYRAILCSLIYNNNLFYYYLYDNEEDINDCFEYFMFFYIVERKKIQKEIIKKLFTYKRYNYFLNKFWLYFNLCKGDYNVLYKLKELDDFKKGKINIYIKKMIELMRQFNIKYDKNIVNIFCNELTYRLTKRCM